MKKNDKFYTPSLPLTRGKSLDYEYHDNILDVVKQNIKNIILTNPGERGMDPTFGVGVTRYMFEQIGTFEQELKSRVESQVKKYAPFVTINSVDVASDGDNAVYVNINYFVPSLNTEDSISTSVRTDVGTGGPKFVI